MLMMGNRINRNIQTIKIWGLETGIAYTYAFVGGMGTGASAGGVHIKYVYVCLRM